MQKIFPKVTFFSSNMPEKWYRIFKKKCQIDQLPEDSLGSQRNMLDRYLASPDESFWNMWREISNMCFSELLSLFHPNLRTSKDLESDYQPVVLDDELLEQERQDCNYPKEIPLMSSKNILKSQLLNPWKNKTSAYIQQEMLDMINSFWWMQYTSHWKRPDHMGKL